MRQDETMRYNAVADAVWNACAGAVTLDPGTTMTFQRPARPDATGPVVRPKGPPGARAG